MVIEQREYSVNGKRLISLIFIKHGGPAAKAGP